MRSISTRFALAFWVLASAFTRLARRIGSHEVCMLPYGKLEGEYSRAGLMTTLVCIARRAYQMLKDELRSLAQAGGEEDISIGCESLVAPYATFRSQRGCLPRRDLAS